MIKVKRINIGVQKVEIREVNADRYLFQMCP